MDILDKDKRSHSLSSKVLENKLAELETKMEEILNVSISEDPALLVVHAKNCKTLFKEHDDLNTKLTELKLKSGCLSEANRLRDQRQELKYEVKQFIKLVNTRLDDDVVNVTFNTSSILNESSESSTLLASASSIHPFSRPVDPVGTSSPLLKVRFAPDVYNSEPSLNIFDTLQPSECLFTPVTLPSFAVPSTSTDTIKVTSAPTLNPTFSFLPPSSFVASTYKDNSLPHLVSSVPSTQSKQSAFHPIVTTVGRNSTFHNYEPFRQPSRSNNPIVPPNLKSAPPVTAPTHMPHQFGQGISSTSGANSNTDALTAHILRNQLFQKVGQPFNGDPHKYHAWVNVMQRKMAGVTLDAWDVLTILFENTTGKPRKIIEDYMNVGAVNPQATLDKVWSVIHDQFGSGSKIAASIMNKLDALPQIKSVHNTDKLAELIHLLHIMSVNIPVAEELRLFDMPFGLRKVWAKLPESLQNSWRTYSSDFKIANGGISPTLAHLTCFLEKKLGEFSDPCYEKMSTLQSFYRPRTDRGTILKTSADVLHIERDTKPHEYVSRSTEQTVPTSERASKPPERAEACPLHPQEKHALGICNAFAKKPFSERRDFLIEERRCFACCGTHLKKFCKANLDCAKCGGPHVTAMHRDPQSRIISNSHIEKPETPHDSTISNLCTAVCGGGLSKSCSKVLLVELSHPSTCNKKLVCYAILDEQSSSSFVDPAVVELFDLRVPKMEYKIRTLSGLETTTSGMEIRGLKVRGMNEKKKLDLPPIRTNEFIPNCKDEVATPSIVSQHSHLAYLAKHFLPFNEQANVLLLLGRDCGEAMLTRCFGFRAPFAHHTPIGWALVGQVCKSVPRTDSTSTVLKIQASTFEHFDVHQMFPKKGLSGTCIDPFVEYPDDEMPGSSQNDDKFIQKVFSSINVNEEGNISMALPFKNNEVSFPDNRRPVYHRTINTLNKMKTDANRLEACVNFMKKNIDAGHVELISDTENIPKSGSRWYIPVFDVTHPKKGKKRLVFDSTAAYAGTSLNNELLQGPDINNRLSTVLHRFRKREIAFTADIESMFHAFHLEPSDKDYTRFFWWKDNNPKEPIVEYRATRHIFGNKCSPSLANLGLRFAVTNSPKSTERAVHFVHENFYVDDGCGSADSPVEAIRILEETRAALATFNIRLHKISSNSAEVLNAFPESELAEENITKDFNHVGTQRTLGVEWDPVNDVFTLRTDVPVKPFTKRGTLATTNSLFDPLGFAAPVALAGRLLQRLFIPPKEKNQETFMLGWDDPLPPQCQQSWYNWIASLRKFDKQISIPRCFYPSHFGPVSEQSLHVFCDASNEGIGCVIYMRCINEKDEVHISFVVANSRVTPRGTTSIPRLELCAAFEASLLALRIAEDLNMDRNIISYYSDSKVVLGYLRNVNRKFSRYVTRRVNIILKSSDADQWNYVPTSENPADISSRPQSFDTLVESCWFRGPNFLWNRNLEIQLVVVETVDLPEIVDESVTLKTTSAERYSHGISSAFDRVSSWSKLVGITRLVLDFIRITSERAMFRRGAHLVPKQPCSEDLAKTVIIKAMQRDFFGGTSSSFDPKIRPLSPFLDGDGIVRVGGRLSQSSFSQHIKHPILLPARHPVTTLIVRHFHLKSKHQGRVITMSFIREAGFFILRGSGTVKRYINTCVVCKRLRAPTASQKMANLPFDRLHETPPFTYCGMDVFGPFHIAESVVTRRSISLRKCWAVIFICLVTKAVHIEPLSSMDTNTFKLALRRFFAIRGVCKKLRCDRGTNFIGAMNQEIQTLEIEALKSEVTLHECEWELNPPHASNFGGLWERSIRKILDASLLTLGKRPTNRDELVAFLLEATSIVNNTPMYEVCDDPNEMLPIAPAALTTLKDHPNPPPLETFNERDILAYGSRRHRRVQALSEIFWNRWRTEYVQRLQIRQKWTKERPNINVGDVVIMKVPVARRNMWPLARIVKIKTSQDGLIRSVSLSVSTSDKRSTPKILDRPISQIVPILQKGESYRFE